ncbi:MAG: tetratricopeptide repeat protein [Chloroflexota bacterium]
MYDATGKPKEALALYEQALPIMREVGDRAGEATTLNNMALVYDATSKPKEALALYEQALPIMREVGDRAGEAATLNGLAYLLVSMEEYEHALSTFTDSIKLEKEVGHRAGESAGWVGMGILLYRHLERPQDADHCIGNAISVLAETGLPQDAAGHTIAQLQQMQLAMRGEEGASSVDSSTPATFPAEQRNLLINNTVAVMTDLPEKQSEWRQTLESVLPQMVQLGADGQHEADYLAAILALLDGKEPALPANHPYAEDLSAIQKGIEKK